MYDACNPSIALMNDFTRLIQRIKSCTLCPLSESRTQAVPGEGNQDADVIFIGEGPGFYEDRDGRPFIGSSGQFLDELLASIRLSRQDVYIANMVKCRPPDNRDPLPGEIKACKPYLDQQLELIRPKVIVTLGRFSFTRFFPGEAIGKSRGKPRTWANYMVMPMYHPAAALHNPKLRPIIQSDFKKLPLLIDQVVKAEIVEMEPQQLDLFSSGE